MNIMYQLRSSRDMSMSDNLREQVCRTTTQMITDDHGQHTWLDDAVDKLLPRDLPVAVGVLTMEKVHDTWPVGPQPLQILHPPRVKVETTQPLHLHSTITTTHRISNTHISNQQSLAESSYVTEQWIDSS